MLVTWLVRWTAPHPITPDVFKRIVVPLDGSTMSEAVLPCVKSLAQACEAEVLLVRVAEPLRPAIYPYGVALLEPIVREARAEANSYIQHIAATLNDAGLRVHADVIDALDVANALLNYAETYGADLIAMSTHGRSGLNRWLLGSVADRVAHHSALPVLLVRQT